MHELNRKFDFNNELNNCTFIKTILMVLIVLYHSILFWSENWFLVVGTPVFQCQLLKYLAVWLNSFHIYTFSLVSGYIFFYVKDEQKRYRDFLSFLKNKTKRLIIPYFFVSLIWVIPAKIFFRESFFIPALLDVFLGIGCAQLWFLLMLFFVFIIAYALYPIIESNNKIIMFFLFLILLQCSLLGTVQKIPNYFQINNVLKHLPLFVLGMKLRQNKTCWLRNIPVWLYVLADIFLCIVFILLKNKTDNSIIAVMLIVIGILLNFVGALMFFFVTQKIIGSRNFYKNVFPFFFKRSMVVYLFHQQIVYFSLWIFNGKINPYFHATVNFFFAFLISILIGSFLMHFKYTRFLLGEK